MLQACSGTLLVYVFATGFPAWRGHGGTEKPSNLAQVTQQVRHSGWGGIQAWSLQAPPHPLPRWSSSSSPVLNACRPLSAHTELSSSISQPLC